MPEDNLPEEVYRDWNPGDNEKMYLGFSSAALPEGANKGMDYLLESSPSLWDSMTQYGLDKVSHFGFSFFGAKSLMKAAETFPEYMKRMEESDAPLSDQIYSAGVKLSEPSMQQKTALALTGVAVIGYGKELTDAYVDMYDMAANMTGASLGVLDEYGEGSIRKGGEKTIQDIKQVLENDEEKIEAPAHSEDGLENTSDQLDEYVEKNLEALGKL